MTNLFGSSAEFVGVFGKVRGLTIDRANQVWCSDITYVPMERGFMYLVAVMD